MALANTIWPSDLVTPPELKQWLADFYETVDSKADNSGTKLAALFTDDGIMHGMSGQVAGKEAIAASRKSAWTAIASRKHVVVCVYAGAKDFSSILIIGNLVAGLHNGNQIDVEFIAQVDLDGVVQERPRATLYKVWGRTVGKSDVFVAAHVCSR
ncbi:hypothetical protein VTL71DRAFT_11347 [Oculimacula yallundae]|uniref:SnoaL-like domain-containing protein n=1 Tax=Oculimacula yallundae TaxID=86028 RepID=A0ABR4CSF0_9HELO